MSSSITSRGDAGGNVAVDRSFVFRLLVTFVLEERTDHRSIGYQSCEEDVNFGLC